MFGFNKKNTTLKADAKDIKGLEESYKKAERTLEELDEKLKPYKEVRAKCEAIISTLYTRHNIPITTWPSIDVALLDFEVIDDLCVFNEQELAVLKKWIPKYKEACTAEVQMIQGAQYEYRINDNM